MTAAAAPPLAPDLAAGLRRLKLAAMRQLAPELLITAKTQRWAPEELLRTLVEAEITARDASNARTRMKQAAFPVTKTLEDLDRSVSPVPAATLDYLASLEWIRAAENLCLVGPPGTGKSHLLVALGVAAVQAGHKVRYHTAADLAETLYRGLADNSVGRIITTLLRNDLIIIDEVGFAPLDHTGAQLLFRVVAAAYERRSLGIASHWPFDQWGPSRTDQAVLTGTSPLSRPRDILPSRPHLTALSNAAYSGLRCRHLATRGRLSNFAWAPWAARNSSATRAATGPGGGPALYGRTSHLRPAASVIASRWMRIRVRSEPESTSGAGHLSGAYFCSPCHLLPGGIVPG